ncbi:HEAT repeat domain-containing protein [Aphanothece sacrum]|uniref:Phycobilisome maturation protein n=1 Tax=Aphanothece sacrum FPU1 TaxID=1920663 RepID=A0A401IGD2_APHSA|nr:HEAT repeat domain-containing protein [Aphanothece sacrum]GBF80345.1 phycobilisome maturation protein [Aphanothece sacrum FPU1]GBF83752.1 phycobilisome maturation protein [Aphanothece sacrum FPU3]
MKDQDVNLLIQSVEKADSSQGLLDAVTDLANSTNEGSIGTLITVLAYNNPGAAVAAVDGLISLGDVAVPALLEQIDGYNYGARAWATRALAGIGHPKSLHHLIEAATSDFSLSVRRAAARGLGNICWDKFPTEELVEAQHQAINTLIGVSQDPEWVVRYGAVVGLQSLLSVLKQTQEPLAFSIVERFHVMLESEPELGVRVRIQLALQEGGFI